MLVNARLGKDSARDMTNRPTAVRPISDSNQQVDVFAFPRRSAAPAPPRPPRQHLADVATVINAHHLPRPDASGRATEG